MLHSTPHLIRARYVQDVLSPNDLQINIVFSTAPARQAFLKLLQEKEYQHLTVGTNKKQSRVYNSYSSSFTASSPSNSLYHSTLSSSSLSFYSYSPTSSSSISSSFYESTPTSSSSASSSDLPSFIPQIDRIISPTQTTICSLSLRPPNELITDLCEASMVKSMECELRRVKWYQMEQQLEQEKRDRKKKEQEDEEQKLQERIRKEENQNQIITMNETANQVDEELVADFPQDVPARDEKQPENQQHRHLVSMAEQYNEEEEREEQENINNISMRSSSYTEDEIADENDDEIHDNGFSDPFDHDDALSDTSTESFESFSDSNSIDTSRSNVSSARITPTRDTLAADEPQCPTVAAAPAAPSNCRRMSIVDVETGEVEVIQSSRSGNEQRPSSKPAIALEKIGEHLLDDRNLEKLQTSFES